MDVLIPALHDRRKIEYVVLDKHLLIQKFSDGVREFADSPDAIVIGGDVRHAFPELAGSEDDLLCVAAGATQEWTLQLLSRSGRGGPVINLSAHAHDDGTLVLLLEDATARATVEQQLLQGSNESKLLLHTVNAAREMLDRVINALDDALLVASPSGVIRAANAAACSIFGVHQGELIGTSLTELLPAGTLVDLHSPLRRSEISAVSARGEDLPLSISISVICDSRSQPEHVVMLARDLRKEKEAERQIGKLRAEKNFLLEEIDDERHFHGIVGNSKVMAAVFKHVEQVAASDATVLLLGETGTGKELVARAIHTLSDRRDCLLVKVNCAAFQSGVVESELFGHEKGAFTGAVTRRAGRFEYAHGGTILLDEIGDLHLETQAKLLRVLQEREFERVGGNAPVHVDVRVIAATNRDLAQEVVAGRFRSDLFFRINIFPIHIPPLRDRREDIPLLVRHFLSRFTSRSNRRVSAIDPDAMDILLKYDWPGTVRELAAVLERAIIIAERDVLRKSDLAFLQKTAPPKRSATSLIDVEKQHILDVLKATDGVIEGARGAAARLGLKPSTLRSKMNKLGIQSQTRQFK
ncbi:MAG: sigma 54-interacting transcriptional regulator [Ignavibacteriae bacterium]|nr:sigma 54-interacting transcriptional regulator [Ignavibacteriota bacterium]